MSSRIEGMEGLDLLGLLEQKSEKPDEQKLAMEESLRMLLQVPGAATMLLEGLFTVMDCKGDPRAGDWPRQTEKMLWMWAEAVMNFESFQELVEANKEMQEKLKMH